MNTGSESLNRSSNKIKVLFVCIHNSARSQMAEAYLNLYGADNFYAESAGIEPGNLNPRVIKVMKEEGIDISGKSTNSVFDFLKEGRKYDYVITVCDETSGEKCPYVPGMCERLHWGFDDPSSFGGSEDEIMNKIRKVRNEIKSKIINFVNSIKI